MKVVIIGAQWAGIVAKLVFRDAGIYEPLSGHKSRKLLAWGKTIEQPIPGIKSIPVRAIFHIDGRPATDDSVYRYHVKTGLLLNAFPVEGMRHHVQSVPVSLMQSINYDYVPIKIDGDAKQIHFYNKSTVDYDILIWTNTLTSLIEVFSPGMLNLDDFVSRPIFIRVSVRPPDAIYGEDVYYVNWITEQSIPCFEYCDLAGQRYYFGFTSMSLVPNKKLTPGMMVPSKVAKGLMSIFLEKNIYCVGKFATWDYGLRLHTVHSKLNALSEEIGYED